MPFLRASSAELAARGTPIPDIILAAAGRTIQSAAVIAYASAGEFARFNPHLHGIFLDGGFDRKGRFVHVPALDLAKLSQYFRSSVLAFFLERKLINDRLARNMLDWRHSGFSVDLSVTIPATFSRAREALAQYIARPPVSLKKMLVEEHAASVLYRSEYNPYFRTNSRLFPAMEFLVEILQHLPDAGARLIRRYGLYSSRSRGTWSRKPYLLRLAPEGWKEQQRCSLHLREACEQKLDESVSARESRAAWARLITKVYDVDPMRCARCGARMRVLAVITDPQQVRRILRYLIKTGAAPPGLDPACLS